MIESLLLKLNEFLPVQRWFADNNMYSTEYNSVHAAKLVECVSITNWLIL